MFAALMLGSQRSSSRTSRSNSALLFIRRFSLFHSGQELSTGLLAVTAGFEADPAMRVIRRKVPHVVGIVSVLPTPDSLQHLAVQQDLARITRERAAGCSTGQKKKGVIPDVGSARLVSSKNLDPLAIGSRDVVLQPIPAAAPG